MGNVGTMVKRFLSNKNTVTLIAIIICTVVLYGFYNWRVKSAVTTTYVCYARQVIPARTQITDEMVSTVKVLSSAKTNNMIQNCSDVVGKYVSYATEIQENSYFYENMTMTSEEMPDSSFDDIPDGYEIYPLKATFESTYSNSVFPGDYIDLFLKTEAENGLLVYGKFIQSIKVLAVKDEDGRNVFETTVETREPSQILFAVPEDLFLLLRKAEYLGLQIDIVPKNNNYSADPGATLISSGWLKELIEKQTEDIPDECLMTSTGIAECKLADNNDDNNGDNGNNPSNPNDNNGGESNDPNANPNTPNNNQ